MDLEVITINKSVIIKCSVYNENQADIYIFIGIHNFLEGHILKLTHN
jgi:hypothetical protein